MMYLHILKHTILLTVLVSIDHRSHKNSGSNSPELKICKCISNKPFDVSSLQPGNNSEAHTRIFLHLAHAAGQGRQTDYVRTVDSDIVVSPYASSQHWDCQSFGLVSVVGKKLRDIPIQDICSDLGPFRYLTLPLYAIKWCETKSHFLGCGKTIAWASWQNTPGLTETLLALTNEPECSSLSTCRSWNYVWLS